MTGPQEPPSTMVPLASRRRGFRLLGKRSGRRAVALERGGGGGDLRVHHRRLLVLDRSNDGGVLAAVGRGVRGGAVGVRVLVFVVGLGLIRLLELELERGARLRGGRRLVLELDGRAARGGGGGGLVWDEGRAARGLVLLWAVELEGGARGAALLVERWPAVVRLVVLDGGLVAVFVDVGRVRLADGRHGGLGLQAGAGAVAEARGQRGGDAGERADGGCGVEGVGGGAGGAEVHGAGGSTVAITARNVVRALAGVLGDGRGRRVAAVAAVGATVAVVRIQAVVAADATAGGRQHAQVVGLEGAVEGAAVLLVAAQLGLQVLDLALGLAQLVLDARQLFLAALQLVLGAGALVLGPPHVLQQRLHLVVRHLAADAGDGWGVEILLGRHEGGQQAVGEGESRAVALGDRGRALQAGFDVVLVFGGDGEVAGVGAGEGVLAHERRVKREAVHAGLGGLEVLRR